MSCHSGYQPIQRHRFIGLMFTLMDRLECWRISLFAYFWVKNVIAKKSLVHKYKVGYWWKSNSLIAFEEKDQEINTGFVELFCSQSKLFLHYMTVQGETESFILFNLFFKNKINFLFHTPIPVPTPSLLLFTLSSPPSNPQRG